MRNVNWTTKQLGLLRETARQCRELVYATIDDVDLENEAFWLGVCGWPRVRGDGGSLYEDRKVAMEVLDVYKNSNPEKFVYSEVHGSHHVHLNDASVVWSVIEPFLQKYSS